MVSRSLSSPRDVALSACPFSGRCKRPSGASRSRTGILVACRPGRPHLQGQGGTCAWFCLSANALQAGDRNRRYVHGLGTGSTCASPSRVGAALREAELLASRNPSVWFRGYADLTKGTVKAFVNNRDADIVGQLAWLDVCVGDLRPPTRYSSDPLRLRVVGVTLQRTPYSARAGLRPASTDLRPVVVDSGSLPMLR